MEAARQMIHKYGINSTIYEIPIIFFNQKLAQVVIKKLGLENGHAEMPWLHVMERFAARSVL